MSDDIFYNEALLPPDAEHFLKRPAVDRLLKDAFQMPLVTVIAGAGFGKTQAVLAALKEMNCNSAWMQLSELDNHATRFWGRIAYIFKEHNHNLYESLISLGFPESITAFDRFLRLLAEELTQKERFIMVFDDFNLIHNKTILNFFELFIDAPIYNLSIVLVSRTKPEFNLTGMMSKGLMTQISEDDLRFSKDEMDAYFEKQGFDLGESVSSDIYSNTEGWVVAIYLVGLAIQKGDINKKNPILAAKIDIFDLIEKEIFLLASKVLQDFLINISVLDAIPSGLLKELVNNDYSLISEMMQISLFIYYDSSSDSYRLHHLLREFLLERKSRLQEDEITKMHLTAAKWYEKNNNTVEAIEHYRECGCYNEIFDIIFSIPSHVSEETADSLIELIEQAPDEIAQSRPIIRVARAKYMFNNNRLDEAKRELLIIQKEYEVLPKTKENQAILGEVYTYLAFISIVNLDYEFEELFKMADECLPDGSKLVDYRTTIAEGVNACSIKNPSAGELKRHQNALFNTMPYASRVMNGCSYGLEYLNAAESSLYTADLRSAEKYAYQAIYRSKRYLQYDIEYMANFVLVRIFTAKGNYTKVSEIIEQMGENIETINISSCISHYDVIKGWFYVKIGMTDKVPKWIKYEEETRKILAPVHMGREYLVRSDCLLAEERYYELLAYMEQTDRVYEDRGILYARIQNKITKAIICHHMGDHKESMDVLYEAYELTNPNGLIMQFVEYGNKMRTLIHATRQNEYCKIPKEWLNTIYTKSSTYAKQLVQVVSEYNEAHELGNNDQAKLSKREMEALTYLCRGLTREEIAESCYLSVSTIDNTLNKIYDKLGAVNSAEAVRIAKEKNLL